MIIVTGASRGLGKAIVERLSKKGEEVIVSLEEHYLGEDNNFPPSVNKDDYVAFRIECQPYIWDNESLTPMRYRPVEPKKELPNV